MESPLCPPVEPDFRLIETLGFRPGQGVIRGNLHLDRMARSADALAVPFDRDKALQMLGGISNDTALRCRLTLDVSGGLELTTGPLADNPPVWNVAISENRLKSSEFWLRHKTTRREVYDTARKGMAVGVDELLFLNERGELCEGTITNLFIETLDGHHLTPPLSSGLLPGVLRQELLENGDISEARLTLTDLKNARKVQVGNSLRGLIRAELVLT